MFSVFQAKLANQVKNHTYEKTKFRKLRNFRFYNFFHGKKTTNMLMIRIRFDERGFLAWCTSVFLGFSFKITEEGVIATIRHCLRQYSSHLSYAIAEKISWLFNVIYLIWLVLERLSIPLDILASENWAMKSFELCKANMQVKANQLEETCKLYIENDECARSGLYFL